MKFFEVNFDGLVGPTHNYAGLSYGNVASMKHQAHRSNPKKAALEGLDKMRLLREAGLIQAVIPPQDRPNFEMLRRLGYSGSEKEVFNKAFETTPDLAIKCFSASSMWTANAATMAPGLDTADAKTHFVAANLASKLHRSIEAKMTSKIFQRIFSNQKFFEHHPVLPTLAFLGDEGAANHTRFCMDYGSAGLHLFVFGGSKVNESLPSPKKFPARQSLEASEAVAKLLKIKKNQFLFLQQNPDAIDAGVFHNDVISVGNKNCFFVHDRAFLNQERALKTLMEKSSDLGIDLNLIRVSEKEVPLKEAVSTYLFNSQIISPEGEDRMLLISPIECQESELVSTYLKKLCADPHSPIGDVKFLNVRESMRNGGGPACLRNRVVLSDEALASIDARVIVDESLEADLRAWVSSHYVEDLDFDKIQDFTFVETCRKALDELTQILKLPQLYGFQSSSPTPPTQ